MPSKKSEYTYLFGSVKVKIESVIGPVNYGDAINYEAVDYKKTVSIFKMVVHSNIAAVDNGDEKDEKIKIGFTKK